MERRMEHNGKNKEHAASPDTAAGRCPVNGGALKYAVSSRKSNRDWWPNALDLSVLRQNSSLSDPMGEGFNYAEEFKSLDIEAVIQDLRHLMTDSQDWWPAD